MQKLFLLLLVCFAFSAQSQTVFYAAAKTGISLREQPNINAKLLEKIAYAGKVISQLDTFPPTKIITEGFSGYWTRVKYNDKYGYVVSNYLLTTPPPKAGIKTLKDYFKQVTEPVGGPLVIKKTNESLNEMGESTLTKQLFKNGMEWHETQAYESGTEVYMLPGFNIQDCFLLLRILNQYPDLIGEKDNFPTKKIRTATATGEKVVDIEKDPEGAPGAIKKITITSTEGVVTEFEIFMLDDQAVIYRSSGV